MRMDGSEPGESSAVEPAVTFVEQMARISCHKMRLQSRYLLDLSTARRVSPVLYLWAGLLGTEVFCTVHAQPVPLHSMICSRSADSAAGDLLRQLM